MQIQKTNLATCVNAYNIAKIFIRNLLFTHHNTECTGINIYSVSFPSKQVCSAILKILTINQCQLKKRDFKGSILVFLHGHRNTASRLC